MVDVTRLDAAVAFNVDSGSYPVSAGTNRGLIVGVQHEGDITPDSVSVTWGGQAMTQLVTTHVEAGGNDLEVTLYLLLEAGIAAGVGTTIILSGELPDFTYHAASYENVNQGGGTDSVPETNSAGTTASTPNPLTTADIVAGDGAAVVALAGVGQVATAAWGADLTEQTELGDVTPTATGSLADGLFATGQNVNVEATWSGQNRAAVVSIELAPTTGAIAGSINLALAATGQLSATVPIAGDIPLTITPTGDIGNAGVGPDIWFKQLVIAVPVSGNTVIDTTDKGLNAFGVHVAWGINTVNQARQDDYTFGHGFSDGTNFRAIMHNAEQNEDNNHRASSDTVSILIKNPVNDDVLVAATITLQATTVTIVYSIQTAGLRINVEIWGGLDGGAVVGDVGADASPLTGLGLAHGDLFLMSTSGEQIPASSQFAYQSYGCSHDNGVSIDQWSLLAYAGDNDVDFKGSALVEGIIAGQYDVDFADWTMTITAQSGDGATWTGANVDHVAFMMLDLDGTGVAVGTFQKATAAAPASQNLPDLGFTPQAYSLATASEILQTTNVDRPCRQSFGAFDGDGAAGRTGRSIISTSAAQVNTDSYSFVDDESVLMTSQTLTAGGGVPDARAKASSVMNSTPEIVWNPNTATADWIGFYALEQKATTGALVGNVPLMIDADATIRGIGDLAGAIPLVLTPTGTIRGIGDLAGAIALAFDVAGIISGGNAQIAGTIPLVITPSGTLVARGELAGAVALVITPAATITALGELTGAVALTITPTGTMLAKAAAAGTINLTLTPAGTAVGLGELAGSIALVLDAAGTLQALANISGSAALLLTPTGTIVGLGELTGSAAMILTPTGTIEATGELIGSLTLLIDATGAISAVQNLSGTIPLTLTATGTLEALAAISGAAQITITPSGTIQATGGLLGSAALTFTLAGDLVALGELLGSIDLVLTPTGIIEGLGALTGSSDLVLTPAGNLVGLGALSGSSDLVFDATAILQGMQAISGTIPLTITPSGTLEGVGAIEGTAALVFDATGNIQSIGTLAGAIPLTLTAAAAILARGALAGSLTLTLTPTGTIIGEGTLAGGVALVFTPTGTLSGGGQISGTVDLTIDAAGNMIAKAIAAGSIDMAITPTGDLGGVGAISGTAQLTLSADGTLRAIGDLAGLATLAFTLAGIMFDQSARRIPNSFQSFMLFLQNSRQNLAEGTDNTSQGIEAGEINSSQSITAGRTNSEQ